MTVRSRLISSALPRRGFFVNRHHRRLRLWGRSRECQCPILGQDLRPTFDAGIEGPEVRGVSA